MKSVSRKTGIDYDGRAVAATKCPACGARKGHACFGSRGVVVAYTHHERRALAAKLAREQRIYWQEDGKKKEAPDLEGAERAAREWAQQTCSRTDDVRIWWVGTNAHHDHHSDNEQCDCLSTLIALLRETERKTVERIVASGRAYVERKAGSHFSTAHLSNWLDDVAKGAWKGSVSDG